MLENGKMGQEQSGWMGVGEFIRGVARLGLGTFLPGEHAGYAPLRPINTRTIVRDTPKSTVPLHKFCAG